MRCATVAQCKRSHSAMLQNVPREGSRLRAIYDLFQSRKGLPVEFYQRRYGAEIRQLTDFYGFDIRRLQSGNSQTGRASLYVLAGEWFGKVYIDYIAERIQ